MGAMVAVAATGGVATALGGAATACVAVTVFGDEGEAGFATMMRPPRMGALRTPFFTESRFVSDSAEPSALGAAWGTDATGGATAFGGGMIVSTGTMPPLPTLGVLPEVAGIFSINAPVTTANAPASATKACFERPLGMSCVGSVGVGVLPPRNGALIRPGVCD